MNQELRVKLEDVLDREVAAAHLLTVILETERAALIGTSTQAVTDKAAEKIRVLGSIEAMEDERRKLWGTGGADPVRFGTVAAQRWRALLDLIARCRAANEINGHIIHIRQNQIRQLFDIVRGGAATTYGPQGKTHASTLRALARA